MGNSPNFCGDKNFLSKLRNHEVDFNAERPLFHAEEVSFPLSTQGIKIVDANGKRVKLAGGNWSGAHMCRHSVDGLECRPLRDIALDIRHKFQMNCIRLTYSLQLFFDDKPVPEKYLTANPELIGKTGMQIFDITIRVLTEVGLMVILNNHTSTSQWCCSNQDGDGLWWSRQYPENMFFECAEAFAVRYRGNPRVIGMDLRNELRKAHGLNTTWGDGNPLTDWKRAAKICSDKVQALAPHWLIFVAGLQWQLDLTGVKESPLHLKIPNKLVYTGHFYGFSWMSANITTWNLVSYESFRDRMFNTQTFVRGLGYPYLLGQFGNNSRDIPWKYLMKYLKQTDIDWTYWSLDGFKCDPSDDETYGVFTNDFSQARHPDMLKDMIQVGPPQGTPAAPMPQNNVNSQLRSSNFNRNQEYQPRISKSPPAYIHPKRVNIIQEGRIMTAEESQYRRAQPAQPSVGPLSPRSYQAGQTQRVGQAQGNQGYQYTQSVQNPINSQGQAVAQSTGNLPQKGFSNAPYTNQGSSFRN